MEKTSRKRGDSWADRTTARQRPGNKGGRHRVAPRMGGSRDRLALPVALGPTGSWSLLVAPGPCRRLLAPLVAPGPHWRLLAPLVAPGPTSSWSPLVAPGPATHPGLLLYKDSWAMPAPRPPEQDRPQRYSRSATRGLPRHSGRPTCPSQVTLVATAPPRSHQRQQWVGHGVNGWEGNTNSEFTDVDSRYVFRGRCTLLHTLCSCAGHHGLFAEGASGH